MARVTIGIKHATKTKKGCRNSFAWLCLLPRLARSLASPGHLRRGMLHRTAFASTIATVNTRMATPSQTHLQIFCSMGILTGSPSPFRKPPNVAGCENESIPVAWFVDFNGCSCYRCHNSHLCALERVDNAADRPFNAFKEKSCSKIGFFQN